MHSLLKLIKVDILIYLKSNPIPAFGDVDDYVFMDTNWQDVLFGNAGSTQHNLSVSGGNEKVVVSSFCRLYV